MTNREIIINFLKDKTKFFEKLTKGKGPKYVTQADLDEIQNEWTDGDCQTVVTTIKHYLNAHITEHLIMWANYSCPWCILHESECNDPTHPCQYGERHGECGSDYANNTFGKIMDNIPSSMNFTNSTEYIEILKKYFS